MTRRTWSTTEISAYLDGRLASQDRVVFEAQIAQDPALQQRVEKMRDVVAMVQSLPLRQPPRNYLLTPSMVADSKPSPKQRRLPLLMMRMATSLVALAFVVTFSLTLLQRGMTPSMARPASPVQEIATSRQDTAQPELSASAPETSEEPPMALRAPSTSEEPPMALGATLPTALPTPAPEGTPAQAAASELAPVAPNADASAPADTVEGSTSDGAAAGMGGGEEGIQAQEAPAGTAEASPEPRTFAAGTIEEPESTSAPEIQKLSGIAEPGEATPTQEAPAVSQAAPAESQAPSLPWVTVGLGVATVALVAITLWLSRRNVG